MKASKVADRCWPNTDDAGSWLPAQRLPLMLTASSAVGSMPRARRMLGATSGATSALFAGWR